MMNEKIAIVLEGGGLRGIYSAGILDYFLENEWHFPYVIGVSMGACNGASYVSRQKGRSLDIPNTYMDDPRYISKRNLIFKGSLFGMDFLFNEVPNKLNVFDYNTFEKSPQKFVIGAMNCSKGVTSYFEKETYSNEEILEIMKASCSLPFVSKMVTFEGDQLLDGGISDPIPLKKALEDGNSKAIVILTREAGYVKGPFKGERFSKAFYKNHPEVTKFMLNRHKIYHDTLDYIEEMEKAGKVLVIRPEAPLPIGRAEKDTVKLNQTYQIGYQDAEKLRTAIMRFANIQENERAI